MAQVSCGVIVVFQLFLRLFKPLCVWALTFLSFLQQGLEGLGEKPFWMLYLVQPFDKAGDGCAPERLLVVLGRFTLGLGHSEKSEVKGKGHVQ